MSDDILEQLAATIRQRRDAEPDTSYTRQLIDAEPEKRIKKFGEEAVETVIAALAQDDAALRGEVADLLYHLLVVLECRNIAIGDVLAELQKRMGLSGLEEKRRRSAGS